jgi:hypothetical protein
MSRWARDNVQPTNAGKTSMAGAKAAMHNGSGNKTIASSGLTRKSSKGSGNKGTLRSLLSGTRDATGKMPFPSMGRARRGRLR